MCTVHTVHFPKHSISRLVLFLSTCACILSYDYFIFQPLSYIPEENIVQFTLLHLFNSFYYFLKNLNRSVTTLKTENMAVL